MAKKKSIATPAKDVPQTLDEANKLLAEIGRTKRKIETEELARDAAVAKTIEVFQPEIDTATADLKSKMTALQAFAEAHKVALLGEDGDRSIDVSNGTIGWRFGNPAVKLDSDVEEDDVVASLKKLGLNKFIRTTETLNRQAILDAPDEIEAVRGLAVEQKETFYVKPTEVADEIVGKAKKLKGAAATNKAETVPKPSKKKAA